MHEKLAIHDVRDMVANLLGVTVETIHDDSNLIELGMDSITMMRLSGKWRRQGIHVEFAQLIADPRLSAWKALLGERDSTDEQCQAPTDVAVDEDAPFELALMQHAYWIGREQGQQLGGVAAHFYNEFDGEGVIPERLESAVQKLFERHGMLRVQILNDGRQRIMPRSPWPGLTIHDLRRRSADVAQQALQDLRARLSHRTMDLSVGAVFDVQLSLLPDALRVAGTRLHVNLDMVAADALSLQVLLLDLAKLYAGAESLPPITYSFPRYQAERRTVRASARRARALSADRAYWQARLDELPAAPRLPTAPHDAKVDTTTVVRRHRWLGPDQVYVFEQLARSHGLTTALALAAVFAEALTAWSDEPRFLLNLPMFGREPLHPEVGMLVGDFTSSVLLAWDGAAPGSFAQRARRLQKQFHADAEHAGYAGVEVLRDLSRARGEQVLAPVVYTSALGLGELLPAAVREHFGTVSWIVSQGPQVWLDAQVTEFDGGLLVNVDARESAFAPGVLDAMFEAHSRLLDRLLTEEAWTQPVPALLPAEQLQMRPAVHAAATPPSGRRLHDSFFEVAQRQPEAPALLWSRDSAISYGELSQRALSVAGYLGEHGVKAGEVVAIHLPMGPDQIVAALGVLAAGAAYLPVGVDQPRLRRERIYQAAGIAHVLDTLPSNHPPCGAPLAGHDSDLAYVLYTSGSADHPKGVSVTHAAAMNTIDDLNRRLSLGEADRTIALSALASDLSAYDVFAPLSVGGAVICVEEPARRDAGVWAELLHHHRGTVLSCEPALLDGILTAVGGHVSDGSLRAVLVAGDQMSLGLPGRLARWVPNCRFIALGGTTEKAIHSSICEITELTPHRKSLPLRIVDRLGRDCPDFVPGDLWVGATGPDRHDSEKDPQRFLQVDGRRWYRTGDRARYWPDGDVELLGRADVPEKPGEHGTEPGRIQAEVAANANAHVAANANADAARGPREALILTAPVGEIERLVAGIWAEQLETPTVGRESNFFASGGDSLLATRLVRRLRDAGLSGVKLAELLARPTLADFAATLQLGQRAPSLPSWVADTANRQRPFPSTEVQRAYWLGRDESFTLGGVGCHFYREYEIVDLDIARLEAAVNALIERHEMLRAVFDAQGQQRILDRVPQFEIEVIDAGDNPQQAHAELRDEYAHKVFDPSQWPLFAMGAVRSGACTRVGISLDNLILDALSILTFYSELSALYETPEAALPPIGLSFRDYVLNCDPEPEALASARAYWKRKLPGLPPAPQLPLARDPAEMRRPRFTRHEGRVAADCWRGIVERAGKYGITPSTVLLSAFSDVLSRWSHRPELTINLTLFDRRELHPDIYRVMGDFTSLTLVGYRPVPGEAWLTRAQRVQREVGDALDHRDVSSISLVRDLARLNGNSEIAMPVVFTSALGVPGGTGAPESGPFSRQVWGLSQTPQVWLDHQVIEAHGGIVLNWDVVEDLFPERLIATMFDAYLRALTWLSSADWTLPLLDLMPEPQRRVRAEVNATEGECPRGTLHGEFFRLARVEPGRIALRWGEAETMTYGGLADRALRMAALLTQHGVEAGEIVAVSLPKGPDQIAAVLGALAAGAAYLPVGVDQPNQRRNRMLAQAKVRFVITDSRSAQWPEGVRCWVFEQAMAAMPAANPAAIDAEQLAYVIFTSGSTGQPKGVEITHCAALNTILDINRRFEIGTEDRVLAVSALDFDLSVYDIFGLLSAGGSLVLIEEESRRDAERWHELVCRHQVTIWNSVPTLLDMLLIIGSEAEPPGALRLALISGDWIGLDLPGRLAEQRPGCQFVALGGATEASIWSNFFEVDRVVPSTWRSIPYGHPLCNQCFRVVDSHGRDCPDWVAGELWIGGLGVARGYCAAPELTAGRFIEDDVRWYRTGDMGRYWPDGTLEFLGRTDNQVKIRGHRIELAEIEAALLTHPEVRQAVALAVDGHLLAAIVLVAEPQAHELTTATADDPSRAARIGSSSELLRDYIATRLPQHMVPEQIQALARLPLSSNGKIDRRELARRLRAENEVALRTLEPPQGEWERSVAVLWKELLTVAEVSREQSFFELGGDSLLATRFIEAVKQRHELTLPLRRLFIAPALRDVAAVLATEHATRQEFDEGEL
ncbi:MAG: amino acid adenylation domain-containing protein [Proteobacteria bacterium]|nr:amino acid adenylation domain-containing protein [Pseudomonadota bacterium]